MKVKVISRSADEFTRERSQDLQRVFRNYDPALHAQARAQEYTRALNATKLDKIFAKPFLAAMSGHIDAISSMAKDPNHLKNIFTGSMDGDIRLWDIATRRTIQQFPGHRGAVRGLAVSTDGEWLASCGDDCVVTQSVAPDFPMKEDLLNQSVATHTQHSPSQRKCKFAIEVALALFGGSLTLMVAMVAMLGGMDKREKVISGNTIYFSLFFITDMLALVASLAVAMILTFDLPGKVAWLMEIIMWLAATFFLLALLAIGFIVMIPVVKWSVLSFIVAGAMVVTLLINRALVSPRRCNTQLAFQMSQRLEVLNVV